MGIGYSLHTGRVVVADGTEDAARRLRRVLTADPGMGIIRHVDAGYEKAIEEASEHGLKAPMLGEVSQLRRAIRKWLSNGAMRRGSLALLWPAAALPSHLLFRFRDQPFYRLLQLRVRCLSESPLHQIPIRRHTGPRSPPPVGHWLCSTACGTNPDGGRPHGIECVRDRTV